MVQAGSTGKGQGHGRGDGNERMVYKTVSDVERAGLDECKSQRIRDGVTAGPWRRRVRLHGDVVWGRIESEVSGRGLGTHTPELEGRGVRGQRSKGSGQSGSQCQKLKSRSGRVH